MRKPNSIRLLRLILLFILVLNANSNCNNYNLDSDDEISNSDFDDPDLSGQNFRIDTPGVVDNWSASKSKIAVGSYLSSQWGSTQVIELDADNQNLRYNQSVSLTVGSQYLVTFLCAASPSRPLSSSGFRILINDVVILD